MTDIDIESEEGAQEKVDAHEELDNPHAESASMADLKDVGGGFEYEQPDDTTFNIRL